ncbi:MAG: hypothetical protein AAGG02_16805 [Cyanobacteria bacterium P01_H01_bin.15]
MKSFDEQQKEAEKLTEIELLLTTLFERDKATAKKILGRLYEIGCVNLISNKLSRLRLLHSPLKSTTKLTKGTFLIAGLFFLQNYCPKLIVNYLHSLVKFDSPPTQALKPAKVEVARLAPMADERELQRLRNQVKLLSGMLLTLALILGGGSAWLFHTGKLKIQFAQPNSGSQFNSWVEPPKSLNSNN